MTAVCGYVILSMRSMSPFAIDVGLFKEKKSVFKLIINVAKHIIFVILKFVNI